MTGESAQAGRALSSGEIDALFRTTMKDETPAGVRDCAILSVLYAGGLRSGRMCCPQGVRRRGQGRGDRAQCLRQASNKPTEGVLEQRRGELASCISRNPRFLPRDGSSGQRGKDGRLTGQSVTDQAIYCVVDKRARDAGLAETTPHDLRRTLTGDLMDKGVDVLVVQRTLGHSDPKTTARYDRRSERAQAAAATTIHVPFRR